VFFLSYTAHCRIRRLGCGGFSLRLLRHKDKTAFNSLGLSGTEFSHRIRAYAIPLILSSDGSRYLATFSASSIG